MDSRAASTAPTDAVKSFSQPASGAGVAAVKAFDILPSRFPFFLSSYFVIPRRGECCLRGRDYTGKEHVRRTRQSITCSFDT
jgi:hypothetical protein